MNKLRGSDGQTKGTSTLGPNYTLIGCRTNVPHVMVYFKWKIMTADMTLFLVAIRVKIVGSVVCSNKSGNSHYSSSNIFRPIKRIKLPD